MVARPGIGRVKDLRVCASNGGPVLHVFECQNMPWLPLYLRKQL